MRIPWKEFWLKLQLMTGIPRFKYMGWLVEQETWLCTKQIWIYHKIAVVQLFFLLRNAIDGDLQNIDCKFVLAPCRRPLSYAMWEAIEFESGLEWRPTSKSRCLFTPLITISLCSPVIPLRTVQWLNHWLHLAWAQEFRRRLNSKKENKHPGNFFRNTMDSYFWERSASLPQDMLDRISFSGLLEENLELREDDEEGVEEEGAVP